MDPQFTMTFPGSFLDGWVTVGLPCTKEKKLLFITM